MKKFYCIALFAAAMFTACDKTPSGTDSVPGAIMISPLVTRVSDLNFDDGDRIGLTIVKEGGETFVSNALMTYGNNVFTGNLTWYPESVTSDLSAYYPYDDAGVPTTFSVETDQSSRTSSSDLVIGVETGVSPSSSAIGMTFRHKLTKIVVAVTNTTGSAISSVVLQGSIPTADVNVPEATVTVSSTATAADITAYAVTADQRYTAIIVPQTVSLTLKVTTADSKEYVQTLSQTEYISGGQYTVNASVSSESGLSITVSGDIEGWTDEGEVGPGEETGDNTGTIEYQGVTYRTVTLSNGSTWMIDPMRYVPEGYTPSDDPTAEAHIWYPYKNDGTGAAVAATDEETIAAKGYLYDMYAILGVTSEELTAENAASFEGAQGICPEGWHIPTWQEYFDLCGYSNKTTPEGSSQTNADALFYDATLNGGSITEFNDAGWNFVCSGSRMKSTFTATPKYQNAWVSETVMEAYSGEPSVNYFATSTFYQAGSNNFQFMAASTTFNNTYKGKVTMMFVHCESGQQLRCVKDAATE